MNVLMISPGFPAEMPLFTAGLAAVGARVIGLGEQPEQALFIDRFGEILIHSGFETALAIAAHCVRGHGDDR